MVDVNLAPEYQSTTEPLTYKAVTKRLATVKARGSGCSVLALVMSCCHRSRYCLSLHEPELRKSREWQLSARRQMAYRM